MFFNLKQNFKFYWWKLFHKSVSSNNIRWWLYRPSFEDNKSNITNSGFPALIKFQEKDAKNNKDILNSKIEQFLIIKKESIKLYGTADYRFLVLNNKKLLNCMACLNFITTDNGFCDHEMVNDDLKLLFKDNTPESRTKVKEKFKELVKSFEDKLLLTYVFSLKYYEDMD